MLIRPCGMEKNLYISGISMGDSILKKSIILRMMMDLICLFRLRW